MKKIVSILLLMACTSTMAQRQKVSVGNDGAMIVNGDTVAYIEREGCKLLSPTCQFYITEADADNLMITATLNSFTDRERRSPEFPNGTNTLYPVFSFRGIDATAEVESPSLTLKAEHVARIIAQWRLIKDKALDTEAVAQFITHYGNRFSEEERRQHTPPATLISW